MEVSAKLSKRRRNYRGVYGQGRSRIPRKVMIRRGTQFVYTGAFVSGAIGGRRAHPPKSEKNFDQKLNKKENRKAIRSAIAATIDKSCLENKGFKTVSNVPFIIDKLETISKTKDIITLFTKLGLEKEIERATNKTIRPGRGTLRGRKYKKVKGPLIIVSQKEKIVDACKNIAGFDITTIKSLNAELLAPGAEPGRLTIWSLDSVNELAKEKLFI
jgi:large subunit ribosomal protein L4e